MTKGKRYLLLGEELVILGTPSLFPEARILSDLEGKDRQKASAIRHLEGLHLERVYGVRTYTGRNGTTHRVLVVCPTSDPTYPIARISSYVGAVLGLTVKDASVVWWGSGMDPIKGIAYELGMALYSDGYRVRGEWL